MVSEISLQCSRVSIPPKGIQDFSLERDIYKFYNPFKRLTFFFCNLGILLPIFHTMPKTNIVEVKFKNGIICQLFNGCSNVLIRLPFCEKI